MVMHAQSGGDYEIMGNMVGYAKGGTMYIMDSFPLPVEASETRVQTTEESQLYMLDEVAAGKSVNRQEVACGWYHSHPGYGVWMSGIDVDNQIKLQKFGMDPCIAIVIDHKRSMAAGKVEIGCYRAYEDD